MRKLTLATLLTSLTLASQAVAAPTLDQIIAQLKAQGFTEITVRKTWLGRYRIEAESATQEREVVFNARTGEILRDYWEDVERDEDTRDDQDEDSSETPDDDDQGESDEQDDDSGDDDGDDDDGDD